MQALASVRDFMWMKYISWNCIVARGLLGIVYIVQVPMNFGSIYQFFSRLLKNSIRWDSVMVVSLQP